MAGFEEQEMAEERVHASMLELPDGEDSFPELPPREGEFQYFSFTTGPAGSGKTFQLRKLIDADPAAGILCATTGVAAVNLGTTTLNSVLGYFDTDSLSEMFVTGRLTRKIMALARDYRAIMIDELSMMDKLQLDMIVDAAMIANSRLPKSYQIAIMVTGDFAQLPPVKADWAFRASHWPRFANNMTKLEKIYRQDNPDFLLALNAARRGDGETCAGILASGATWTVAIDTKFDGTTIVAKNDEVERINRVRYLSLPGKEYKFAATRAGKLKTEWKLIPDNLDLKIGALVMILTNGRDGKEILYANGDTGYIESIEDGRVYVKLKRNGQTHVINQLTRYVESKEEPKTVYASDAFQPYYSETRRRWILGYVCYLPVRLCYASTIHKSQGLTLEDVQIDPRGHFFGSANFAYVGLSRCKTMEGLKIIGTPQLLAKRIKIADEVREWV